MKSYLVFGGPPNASGLPHYPSLPPGLTYVGACQTDFLKLSLQGYFSVKDKGGYYSNGLKACSFPDDAGWLAARGPSHTAAPTYATLPSGLVDDGVCAGPVPAIFFGAFLTADGKNFYANGLGHACSLTSGSAWPAVGGPVDAGLPTYPALPKTLAYDGACATPAPAQLAGYFYTKAGKKYYGTGQGQACEFPSEIEYLAAGGSPNLSALPVFSSFPSNLIYAGFCRTTPIKMVDCTIRGNCSNYKTGGGYAYGPSIVKWKGEYHVFFCSTGNSGEGTGRGWDDIGYIHSSDAINWSTPKVVLIATQISGTPGAKEDFSACDPSIVYFKGYFYLYYGSAYLSPAGHTLGDVQVARSSGIDGPYLTYTTDDRWERGARNPKILIKPLLDLPNNYGAGQPSVLVFNGHLRMFYNDVSVNKVMMVDSIEPASWSYSTASETTSGFGDSDVKYDSASGLFTMYFMGRNKFDQLTLMTASSADGMIWQQPREADLQFPSVNYGANNVGASGDEQGHAIPGNAVLISFGAPYSLETLLPNTSWANWNLYGIFTRSGNAP